MPVLETTPTQTSQFSGISGGLYFAMLIIFGLILGYLVIRYITQWWFGHGMMVAKDAWQKSFAIIQHFETGKNAILKLARIEGDAFRHQQVRDGTLAAMPNGVNLLGGKVLANTWSLFGATVPPMLLAGIASLKSLGFSDSQDVNDYMGSEESKISGSTVVLTGYDFENLDNLLEQSCKRRLLPLSIEDVPKFIKKSINPHDTEYIVNLEVQNEMGSVKDDSLKWVMATAIAVFIVSLGFVAIYNTVIGAGGTH